MSASACPFTPSGPASFGVKTVSSNFFNGLALLTLRLMTCPNALTPLSVRPHLLYSHPSHVTSSFPSLSSFTSFGNINFVFRNARHRTSSTGGKGVGLLAWCSKPLYSLPRYASFKAINRVAYRDSSNGLAFFFCFFGAGACKGVEEVDGRQRGGFVLTAFCCSRSRRSRSVMRSMSWVLVQEVYSVWDGVLLRSSFGFCDMLCERRTAFAKREVDPARRVAVARLTTRCSITFGNFDAVTDMKFKVWRVCVYFSTLSVALRISERQPDLQLLLSVFKDLDQSLLC